MCTVKNMENAKCVGVTLLGCFLDFGNECCLKMGKQTKQTKTEMYFNLKLWH